MWDCIHTQTWQTRAPRLSHAHFPRCPRAKRHMTAGRWADLVVHVLCTLLFLCLSASLHLWSDTVELTPRSPPLDSEADSCITESGLCCWVMTAEAESSTAVCAGPEWAERVTPGRRHCSQLILSLVKNQHAAAVQSEKWGCLPTEHTVYTRNLTWLIVVAVKSSNKSCSHVFGSGLPELTLSSLHLTCFCRLVFSLQNLQSYFVNSFLSVLPITLCSKFAHH